MVRALLFVGHGGVPTDFPRHDLTQLKRLEGERRRTGAPISAEESALDAKIRNWPRNAATDPYLSGFEVLASALRTRVPYPVFTAYNEFCGPTIEQAVEQARASDVTELLVLTTMLTPGGSHAAIEIPEVLAECRGRHPEMTITYAWPFDPNTIASFLADHVAGYWQSPT